MADQQQQQYTKEQIWQKAICFEQDTWAEMSNGNCFYFNLILFVQSKIDVAMGQKIIPWK